MEGMILVVESEKYKESMNKMVSHIDSDIAVVGHGNNIRNNLTSGQVELLCSEKVVPVEMELRMFSDMSEEMGKEYYDIPIKPKKRTDRYKSPSWNF